MNLFLYVYMEVYYPTSYNTNMYSIFHDELQMFYNYHSLFFYFFTSSGLVVSTLMDAVGLDFSLRHLTISNI